jgi:pimeloyl-ACP methyl ester carboxylesterase
VGSDLPVDIVAHSQGGLIARTYLQFLGGTARVAHLVTIGTPHFGVPTVGGGGIELPVPTEVGPIVAPVVSKALPLAQDIVVRGTDAARRVTRPYPRARAGVERALPIVTQLASAGVSTARTGLEAAASPALRQMLQTSPFMRRLNESEVTPGPTQYLSIAARHDGIVPFASAHLPLADNVANVTLEDGWLLGNHVGIVSVNPNALAATLEFLRR